MRPLGWNMTVKSGAAYGLAGWWADWMVADCHAPSRQRLTGGSPVAGTGSRGHAYA